MSALPGLARPYTLAVKGQNGEFLSAATVRYHSVVMAEHAPSGDTCGHFGIDYPVDVALDGSVEGHR